MLAALYIGAFCGIAIAVSAVTLVVMIIIKLVQGVS